VEALSLTELLFFCLVVILSYSIRGSAGFGGVTVPLLALVLSLKVVVPVVTFLGLISSWTILTTDRRYVAWHALWRIAPSALVGALLGLYFFAALDPRTLAQALAILVIAYGGYSLYGTFRPPPDANVPLKALVPVVGTVAGFVGTLFGAMAGIFFAIYLDLLKFSKNEFRATASAILFGLGIVRGLGYVVVGAFDRDALIACAAALPLMGVGIFIGNRMHATLNPLAFRRLIAVILIVSGLPLLLR
jgi:uncharacterized protein